MAIINRRLSNVERGHSGVRVRLASCQIKPEAHFVKRRHVAGFRPTIFITLDFAKVTKEASRERFREVWSEEGRETMVKTARTNPAVFFATCARLIPNDVRVTVQQQLPGNLSAEDWAIMREIVEAVKQAIPDAAHAKPGEVFEHVLSALRQAERKTIDNV